MTPAWDRHVAEWERAERDAHDRAWRGLVAACAALGTDISRDCVHRETVDGMATATHFRLGVSVRVDI